MWWSATRNSAEVRLFQHVLTFHAKLTLAQAAPQRPPIDGQPSAQTLARLPHRLDVASRLQPRWYAPIRQATDDIYWRAASIADAPTSVSFAPSRTTRSPTSKFLRCVAKS